MEASALALVPEKLFHMQATVFYAINYVKSAMNNNVWNVNTILK